MTVPGNGVWKYLALALLSALLAGAGTVLAGSNDAAKLEARVAVQEEKSRSFEAWLDRVETKLDRVLAAPRP